MPTARCQLFTLRIQDETPIWEGKKNLPAIHTESRLKTTLLQFVIQQYRHGQYHPVPSPWVNKSPHTPFLYSTTSSVHRRGFMCEQKNSAFWAVSDAKNSATSVHRRHGKTGLRMDCVGTASDQLWLGGSWDMCLRSGAREQLQTLFVEALYRLGWVSVLRRLLGSD